MIDRQDNECTGIEDRAADARALPGTADSLSRTS